MKDLKLPKLNLKSLNKFFRYGESPEADWKIILTVFIVVCTLIVIAAIYFFLLINSGGLFSKEVEETPSEQTFNLNKLRQTLNHYENKKAELNIATSTPETILDPSI